MAGQWFTDASTRCEAVRTFADRASVQCTRDRHDGGPHESLYLNTAWAE